MARMMRAMRWRRVTPTFGYDLKGSYRAQERRAAQAEIDASQEEIEEDERLRECWCFHYSLYPAEFADHVLDLYGIPRPPSRARRTP